MTTARRFTVSICLITLLAGLASEAQAVAPSPVVTLVSGTVTDDAGKPIALAIVEAVDTDVSAVLTDERGQYKFYLVNQKGRFTLCATKQGYGKIQSAPMAASGTVAFDAVMAPISPVSVEMLKFTQGVSIEGKVRGMEPNETKDFKVLVYVLTDKWYIHPFAENSEGRGYAAIATDGSWNLRTVNRRHNPFKIAIVVVSRSAFPPAAVAVGEDAQADLVAKFKGNIKAMAVLDAPKGM